jgi:hypothetical protein
MLAGWSTGRKVAAATAMVCALMVSGLVWVHHTIGFWDPSTGLVQHLCLRRETQQVEQMRALGDPMFAAAAIRQHHDLSCGGESGVTDVSYALPYRPRREVEHVLGSAGWTSVGAGMASPTGEFCVSTATHNPGLPLRYTEVDIMPCALEDD